MNDDATAFGTPMSADAGTARDACFEVMLATLRFIDDGRATRATDLFTDDAVLNRPTSSHAGKDAVAQFLREREAGARTVHVVSNFSFELCGESTAEASAIFSVYELAEPVPAVVLAPARLTRAIDQYRLVDGRWKITQRDLTWLTQ